MRTHVSPLATIRPLGAYRRSPHLPSNKPPNYSSTCNDIDEGFIISPASLARTQIANLQISSGEPFRATTTHGRVYVCSAPAAMGIDDCRSCSTHIGCRHVWRDVASVCVCVRVCSLPGIDDSGDVTHARVTLGSPVRSATPQGCGTGRGNGCGGRAGCLGHRPVLQRANKLPPPTLVTPGVSWCRAPSRGPQSSSLSARRYVPRSR